MLTVLTINSSIKPCLIKEAKYMAKIEAFQANITTAPTPIKKDKANDKPITLKLFININSNNSGERAFPIDCPEDKEVILSISFIWSSNVDST